MQASLLLKYTVQVQVPQHWPPCTCSCYSSSCLVLLRPTQRASQPQYHRLQLGSPSPASSRQFSRRTQQVHAAGDSSRGGEGGGGGGGLLGVLQQWQQDTRNLQAQLQSLGLAGVVAYGLFNTAYYTLAFLFVWFTVANAPSGLGLQAAARKAAEVFALVWAGSQVTKLLRAAAALAFAPVVDRGLGLAVERLQLKNKQQAFALVVAACAALAAVVFGAVVAAHA